MSDSFQYTVTLVKDWFPLKKANENSDSIHSSKFVVSFLLELDLSFIQVILNP